MNLDTDWNWQDVTQMFSVCAVFWAYLGNLHGGLICITFRLSACHWTKIQTGLGLGTKTDQSPRPWGWWPATCVFPMKLRTVVFESTHNLPKDIEASVVLNTPHATRTAYKMYGARGQSRVQDSQPCMVSHEVWCTSPNVGSMSTPSCISLCEQMTFRNSFPFVSTCIVHASYKLYTTSTFFGGFAIH